MSSNVTTKSLLMTFAATLALTACGNGADRVVSPGEGSFPPAPVPAPVRSVQVPMVGLRRPSSISVWCCRINVVLGVRLVSIRM